MRKKYSDILSDILLITLSLVLVTYLKDPFLTVFIVIVIYSIVKLLKSIKRDKNNKVEDN
ncbi:hypothetical protein [Peptoniphilus rhinitidis]|uniref:hypothetical protein n=1 Tax=Peptoniphilus rhinitidis TaxID=1175452 RepID=UPI0002F71270|nr:hypothetical protein [Peptoniphilus rhinitidis]